MQPAVTSYRAFLSYSRSDDKFAEWVHRYLDSYRIPKTLVGVTTVRGPIPKRLGPVFRDRSDLPTGGELSQRIESALRQSDALVVLCSPQAAASSWVDAEVATFIALRGPGYVFPVILPHLPDARDLERDYFPPALRGRGVLAADYRYLRTARGRVGDGRRDASVKLVAGMIGVDPDLLAQRERSRARRRLALVLAIAFSLVSLAVLAAALVVLRRRESASRTLDETNEYLAAGETGLGLALLATSRLDALPMRTEAALDVAARIHRAALEPLPGRPSALAPGPVYRVGKALFLVTGNGPVRFPIAEVSELFVEGSKAKALAFGKGGAWEVDLGTGQTRLLKGFNPSSMIDVFYREGSWLALGNNVDAGWNVGISVGSNTELLAVARADGTTSGTVVASPLTGIHTDGACQAAWFATGLHEHPLVTGTEHDLAQTARLAEGPDGLSGRVGVWGLSFSSPRPPDSRELGNRFASVPSPEQFEAAMSQYPSLADGCRSFHAERVTPDLDMRLDLPVPSVRVPSWVPVSVHLAKGMPEELGRKYADTEAARFSNQAKPELGFRVGPAYVAIGSYPLNPQLMAYSICSSVATTCTELVADGDHEVKIEERLGIVHTAKSPLGRGIVAATFFDAVRLETLVWPASTFPAHMSAFDTTQDGGLVSVDSSGRIRVMALSGQRQLENRTEFYFPSLADTWLLLAMGRDDFIALSREGELRRFEGSTRQVRWSVNVRGLVPNPYSGDDFVNASTPPVVGAVSADGATVMVATIDRGVVIFDSATGLLLSPLWPLSRFASASRFDSHSVALAGDSLHVEAFGIGFNLALSPGANRHLGFSPCAIGATVSNGGVKRVEVTGSVATLRECGLGFLVP